MNFIFIKIDELNFHQDVKFHFYPIDEYQFDQKD